jgi:GNAT superfamily N-acetyltransferase
MNIRLTTMCPDPFNRYPQLFDIWPEPYLTSAVEATNEDWGDGSVFFIEADHQVVGITGLFFEEEDKENAFLRWTGVIPCMRRRGITSYIVDLMALMAVNLCKRTGYLIELVPYNDYGHFESGAYPFFTDLGFKQLSGIKHEQTDWQVRVMGLALEKYRTKNA